MPVPYSAEELRAATLELVARNGLRSCYIRPIVNRGYGQMGLNPLEAPVDVTIACWEWGAYLGEEGKRDGVRAKVSSWQAHQRRLADPPREGLRAVPQQRAREGGVAEGRLRGGDPARPARPRVRGHRRERLHRARRGDRDPRTAQLDPRRDRAAIDHPDRAGPRLHGRGARRRPRRDVPRRRGVPDRDRGRAGARARDRRPPDRDRQAGRGDAGPGGGLRRRCPRPHRELPRVARRGRGQALQTPTGEAADAESADHAAG